LSRIRGVFPIKSRMLSVSMVLLLNPLYS